MIYDYGWCSKHILSRLGLPQCSRVNIQAVEVLQQQGGIHLLYGGIHTPKQGVLNIKWTIVNCLRMF